MRTEEMVASGKYSADAAASYGECYLLIANTLSLHHTTNLIRETVATTSIIVIELDV